MAPAGSRELAEAYERHRARKAWGVYWGILTLVVLISAVQAAIAWAPESKTIGWLGGTLGAAVGVAGALSGVFISIRRGRIQSRYRKLLNEQ